MMNKSQYWALFGALTVFLILYLGFKTRPSDQQVLDASRALQGETTSWETLLEDAKAHLSAEQSAQLLELEKQVEDAKNAEGQVAALKNISGWWYRQGQGLVAGGFAEQVAELENTDAAWSIAGATYYHALVGEQNARFRTYGSKHALQSFESAASLNPENVEHRVNIALVYAEEPPPDNPMKAVLLLRELEAKYPESPAVYNALGRLAIKTGQWERAIQRLEKAWSIDPANPNTPCLLARAYEGAGQAQKAAEFAAKCAN